jgi:hypothetical protein
MVSSWSSSLLAWRCREEEILFICPVLDDGYVVCYFLVDDSVAFAFECWVDGSIDERRKSVIAYLHFLHYHCISEQRKR